MNKTSSIIYLIKYCLWGLLLGLLILFFMPDSRLSFNWKSAQQAWQFFQSHANGANSKTKALTVEDISFANAVEKASPSVVSIKVFRPKGLRDSNLLRPDEKILDVSVGIGSGVILSAQGYIVTNYHVIKDSERVSISLRDGRKQYVEIVGYDQRSDIAVLKTELEGLKAAELATSTNVRTGDIVMAIGNPFALDQQSVSLGIVSAVHLPDSIQTDAAINIGNSGGALINLHGEVIGINRGRFSSRGGGQTGLNYAIPIVQVKRIAEDIILYGKFRQNWFGINAVELIRRDHQRLFPEIPPGSGFFVKSVDHNSPAFIAGLEKEDFITRFNDQNITGIASFYRLFYDIPFGKKVELELIRKGKLLNVSVQFFEKPNQEG